MTPDGFRRLALSLPEAIESAHMGHPDFRVGGRIFATLGSPDSSHGMVKLKPDQQALFEKLNKAKYPARFTLFQNGNHGTPIRMIDWRKVLNWILAA